MIEREGPTRTWECRCGATVERYHGDGDVVCPRCGQEFNTFGQPLRSDWRSNRSWWDEEVDDLDGFEQAAVAGEV